MSNGSSAPNGIGGWSPQPTDGSPADRDGQFGISPNGLAAGPNGASPNGISAPAHSHSGAAPTRSAPSR
jgi:hypothetical protein